MKTFTYKTAKLAFFGILVSMSTIQLKAQEDLVPDQNPNYKRSMEKYMAQKDELLKNEGKTVQATYKAIDDMEIKQQRKDQRRLFRQERRLARINNRGRFYSPYYYGNGYSPYGYGYNNYGYNNFGYNYGYSPASYYSPYSIGLNTVNTVASTALLGLGLYWAFHH